MRAVIQRVTSARVLINEMEYSRIGRGLLALARISQKLRRKTLTEGPKSSVNGASYQRVKRNPARRKESAANEKKFRGAESKLAKLSTRIRQSDREERSKTDS